MNFGCQPTMTVAYGLGLEMGKLAAEAQEVTGGKVKIAFADQGYTGDAPAIQAAKTA